MSTAATEWAQVARKHAEGLSALRQKEQAPFDLNKDGDVDPELWVQFAAARYQRRVREQAALWEDLLRRYDHNRDGQLTRGEAKALIDEFAATLAARQQGDDVRLAKHRLYLRHFDLNQDGLVSDVESAVGYAFERESKRKAIDSQVITVGVVWEQK